MTTYRNPSGWSITHSGGRLADIYTPQGSCVDCVQARPWDWERNPSDQEEYAVTEELLASLLATYLADTNDMGGCVHLSDNDINRMSVSHARGQGWETPWGTFPEAMSDAADDSLGAAHSLALFAEEAREYSGARVADIECPGCGYDYPALVLPVGFITSKA